MAKNSNSDGSYHKGNRRQQKDHSIGENISDAERQKLYAAVNDSDDSDDIEAPSKVKVSTDSSKVEHTSAVIARRRHMLISAYGDAVDDATSSLILSIAKAFSSSVPAASVEPYTQDAAHIGLKFLMRRDPLVIYRSVNVAMFNLVDNNSIMPIVLPLAQLRVSEGALIGCALVANPGVLKPTSKLYSSSITPATTLIDRVAERELVVVAYVIDLKEARIYTSVLDLHDIGGVATKEKSIQSIASEIIMGQHSNMATSVKIDDEGAVSFTPLVPDSPLAIVNDRQRDVDYQGYVELLQRMAFNFRNEVLTSHGIIRSSGSQQKDNTIFDIIGTFKMTSIAGLPETLADDEMPRHMSRSLLEEFAIDPVPIGCYFTNSVSLRVLAEPTEDRGRQNVTQTLNKFNITVTRSAIEIRTFKIPV